MDTYNYSDLLNLTDDLIGQKILLVGRIHKIRRAGGLCFLILRYQTKTIQCICKKNDLGKDSFIELTNLPIESVVQLFGSLSKLPETINQVDSTYYKHMEFVVNKFNLVSRSSVELPFSITDADSTEDYTSNILIDTRLNNRGLDLRVPITFCIMKLRSGLVKYFREYLTENKFIEIQTPKILGTASESGASVFKIKYFDKDASLAQSPQLYKQMAISADYDRVFEIGPVFRAENSSSNRHLCEFTGLDIEMCIKPDGTGQYNYRDVTDLIWKLIKSIQSKLYVNFGEEIEYIRKRNNFQDLILPDEPVYFDFQDAVLLLKQNGIHMEDTDDLSTVGEKMLGKLMKEMTGSDMFILTGYPSKVRPFYTMLNEDKTYSKSYDIILNGIEISSGAQRIHQYDELLQRLVDLEIPIEPLKGYLDSFKYGCNPHAGCGLGLERLVMLFFGLQNVKEASFCPRDPSRLYP